MASQDPYNLVKQELQETVNELQEKFVRWSEYRPSNPLRAKTGEDLERGCNSVLWQLDELQQAIDVATRDPVRFNITDAELGNRQAWVRNTRRQIHTIQESVKASSERTQRSDLGASSRHAHENDAFLRDQKMEQEMVIRRQDEELENMEKTVSRIGNVGLTIHGELTSQQQLLNAMDEDVDITGSRIKAAQAKIQDILKRSSGNCQMCTIIGLTVVLLILIVVAVAV